MRSAPTPEVLPSRRVLLHGVRSWRSRTTLQYYDPLGLPLRSDRFHLRLMRCASPRRRQRRRASRVPLFSLYTCSVPYPAEARRVLRHMRVTCCLRRDVIGSALGLFLCRGCRLHFMLRPAYLLPAARLSPPRGLSTPRSGPADLSARLGSATRRSGAYRGGTFPRWRSAARSAPAPHSRAGRSPIVTTHHGGSVSSCARTSTEVAARLQGSGRRW